MSPRLLIYTASAGSGKTYRLVSHYISLAIQAPRAYRNILCLTFTNKATAEMRNRILEATHAICQGKKQELCLEISRNTGFPEPLVIEKAAELQDELLHGYGKFQVTTLDTFFQQVIRSFQQELHLGSGQRLEMDPEPAIDAVIQELLETMDARPTMEKWLLDFTEFRIRNGNSWDVEGELRSMCWLLFNEAYRSLLDSVVDIRDYEARCKATQVYCRQQLRTMDDEIRTIERDAAALLDVFGITTEQLFRKTTGPYNFLLQFSTKWYKEPVSGRKFVMDMYLDPTGIAKPEVIGGTANHTAFSAEYGRLNARAVDFCLNKTIPYNTFQLISQTIFGSAILVELDRLLQEYRVRENVLFLPDATRILSGMLQSTDTPFFYERTGNAIHYLLLDEFQDTSWLQWFALRPLLENAIAAHPHASLIVGDAKQAIYRWRNGDARLLMEVAPAEFRDAVQLDTLRENWRSGHRIVHFNNAVFIEGVTVPAQTFRAQYDVEPALLLKTYEPSALQVPMKNFEGFIGWYVPVSTAGSAEESREDEEKGDSLTWLNEAVYQRVCACLEAGFSESDVAILTLRKEDARRYAAYLSGMPYPKARERTLRVESQEGLKLETSQRVGALIAIAERVAGFNHPEILARCRLRLQTLEATGEINALVPEPAISLEAWWAEHMEPRMPQFRGAVAEFFAEVCRTCQIAGEGSDLYVSTLLDHADAFDRSGAGGLQAFIDTWYEIGREKWEIPASERAAGIRIMTFHKSKGLQFPVVILPQPDKPFVKYRHDVLLPVSSDGKFGLQIPFATIRTGNMAKDSAFADQVTEERQMAYIDAWNEGYVAFTRAESALIILSNRHPEKKTGRTPGLLSLIADATLPYLIQQGIPTDPEQGVWFETGVLEPVNKTETHADVTEIQPVSLSGLMRPQAIRLRPPEAPARDTRFGELFHLMLSWSNAIHDIPAAALTMLRSGEYPADLIDEAAAILTQMMQVAELEPYFRPGLKVKSECGILLPEGRVARPDRIVYVPGHCMVLECKTGKPEASHQQQLQRYLDLVRSLEGPEIEVRGMLVYTESMEIIHL